MVALLGVVMIAAGLTWMFGPWGLVGVGAALMVGVPALVEEHAEEVETDG